MVSFNVSPVKVGKSPLRTTNIATLVGKGAEACGANKPFVKKVNMNPFVGAIHHAYEDHFPLVLSPDDVWTVIAQGFATHVNENTEALRDRFVRHQGQEVLKVRRDSFVKGSPNNDWQGCFGEFSDQIADRIGKQRDLLVADFLTTGPIEQAATEVILMGAMKGYFKYEVHTKCGIPNVTLLGPTADWKIIRRRAEQFTEYDLEWWTKALLPVLDQFVAASSGNPDMNFWQQLYKVYNGSGGATVSGHVNAFFPYLHREPWGEHAEVYVNKHVGVSKDMAWTGPGINNFPLGMTKVPFVWDYLGTRIDMNFAGGFVGIAQDPETLAVSPAIGWTVSGA